jgi:transcriptional regulator with XRE-family HTH domain
MRQERNIDRERVAKMVRRIRDANSLTQRELADAIDVGLATVGRWENGGPGAPALESVSRLIWLAPDRGTAVALLDALDARELAYIARATYPTAWYEPWDNTGANGNERTNENEGGDDE